MTKIRETTYQKLSQELGTIEKRRREIIKQLKATPELAVKYLNDTLTSFLKEKSGRWFYRPIQPNQKEEISHWQLISFSITESTPSISERKSSVIVNVKLTWEGYIGNSFQKTSKEEIIKISAFNDVEGQVLNGRKVATNFDEKFIIKNALSEKKKLLEEQLKAVKEEITKLK